METSQDLDYYKMNDIDALAQQNSSNPKHKRRTRNESSFDRNYNCGCGKSYLSYPALYLHLKNKHDGKAPQGTNLPNANGKGSRGRPKKEDYNDKYKEDDSYIENDEAIQYLVQYLENIERHFKRDEKVFQRSPEFLQKIMEAFPKDDFFNERNDYLLVQFYLDRIFQGIEDINRDDDEDDEDSLSRGLNDNSSSQNGQDNIQRPRERNHGLSINSQNDVQQDELRNTKIDKILAIFLFKISKLISFQCFREIAYFLLLYRKSLNMNGWEIQQKLKNQSQIQQQLQQNLGDYCSQNNGEFALEICNDFILTDLPKYLKETPGALSKSFMILGENKQCTRNAVYVTQYFTDWLFDNNYTSSKLQITNDQYRTVDYYTNQNKLS